MSYLPYIQSRLKRVIKLSSFRKRPKNLHSLIFFVLYKDGKIVEQNFLENFIFYQLSWMCMNKRLIQNSKNGRKFIYQVVKFPELFTKKTLNIFWFFFLQSFENLVRIKVLIYKLLCYLSYICTVYLFSPKIFFSSKFCYAKNFYVTIFLRHNFLCDNFAYAKFFYVTIILRQNCWYI